MPSSNTMTEREWLILLNLIVELSPLSAKRLLDAFGSAQAVFQAGTDQLRGVERITPALAARIVAQARHREAVAEELRRARTAGCTVVTRVDEGFPPTLKTIPDPPPVLYVQGTFLKEDETAVAIVGSRRASLDGQQIAQRLAADLAVRGVTIVSGLARGIDAAAHRGALQARGRTLAVLGSGVDRIYPPEHRELAGQIVQRGAIMSEYPLGTAPLAYNFPRRNRIISGLSLGAVIVEAAQRSGALITADCALEQGREVFAVPGKVDSMTSVGTHRLLKQGARLVTGVEDIIEELRLRPITPVAEAEDLMPASHPARGDLSKPEGQVLAQVASREPMEIDQLVSTTGLSAAICSATLLQLELKRLVKQLPGKRFIKT